MEKGESEEMWELVGLVGELTGKIQFSE